jgi:hypothetical protein
MGLVAAVIGALVVSVGPSGPLVQLAQADEATEKTMKSKAREAMENYDLMEYEDAKRLLNEAISLAKRKRMGDHILVAHLYLHLGIVLFSGFQDVEGARVAFIDAISINPKIQVNPAYRTGELEKLVEEARAELAGSSGSSGSSDPDPEPPAVDDGVDCDALVGISHQLVDSADSGEDKSISAYVSPELEAAKISLNYRTQGKTEFNEVAMKKRGACGYAGVVPAAAMQGEVIHYYIGVYNGGGKLIAKKGSAASPNIIELVGGAGGTSIGGSGDDMEDPLNSRRRISGGGSSSSGGSVSGGARGGPKRSKFFIGVAVGTGGGYVSGTTEQAANDVSCCFAPALAHVLPELGYKLSAQNSIGLGVRLGFPVGADLPGHATLAPAGLLRFRHAMAKTGDGLSVSGVLGGGIIRHTVPLAGDMGTDTSATGPLFLGGGVGYTKPFGGSLSLVADATTMLGIPIISELGTCPGVGCVKPNFALQIDLNLGLQLAF